jgi:Holliday junction DNA helicase RuvA
MYDYISGKVTQLSPTFVIIDNQGIGYTLHISMNTYELIRNQTDSKLYTHLVVKEDSHTLFGFITIEERELFLKLIGVNGVGAATARMILSSLSVEETTNAILNGNVGLLKTIKGIGPKAAQRLIVELQDRLNPVEINLSGSSTSSDHVNEASEALVALGFNRASVQKVLLKLCQNSKDSISTEELIKKSLQML